MEDEKFESLSNSIWNWVKIGVLICFMLWAVMSVGFCTATEIKKEYRKFQSV